MPQREAREKDDVLAARLAASDEVLRLAGTTAREETVSTATRELSLYCMAASNRGVSDEINPNKAPPMKLTAIRKPTVVSAVSIVFVRDFFGRHRQPIPREKTGANAVILADPLMSGGIKLRRSAFLAALQMAASNLRNQGKKWTDMSST
jgi:hypothetical protein